MGPSNPLTGLLDPWQPWIASGNRNPEVRSNPIKKRK